MVVCSAAAGGRGAKRRHVHSTVLAHLIEVVTPSAGPRFSQETSGSTRPRRLPPRQAFSDVFPHLVTATDVPSLVKIDDVKWDDVDAVFCCLPHATTQV